MVIKRSIGEKIFDLFNNTFMLFLMIIMSYPFIYVFSASLSDSNELMKHAGFLLFPLDFNLNAYELVLKNPAVYTGYQVTLLVVIVGTAFNIVMTSLGAYVLSRKGVMWKKVIMFMIVFTMFFSGGMIPFYLLVNNTLHLGNNILALILPGSISTWNLIVMRTSFQAIPDSLEESAKMDGANDFTVLFKIILPLSKPVIAVMILFYGVGHWNSWFNAFLFIRNRNLFPLQIVLREILIANSSDSMMTSSSQSDHQAIGESIKHATVMVATLPILFAYPFLQKYFVKGVMVGAIKG